MVVEDNERDERFELMALGLVWREGLGSGWLFLRGLTLEMRVAEADLLGWRVGEESRDANGDGGMELLADDGFEVWVLLVVVVDGVADGSGVLERRLLAAVVAEWPSPTGPSPTAEDLSMVMEAGSNSGARVSQSCQRAGLSRIDEWQCGRQAGSSWLARHRGRTWGGRRAEP